jgi:hypothetical protein
MAGTPWHLIRGRGFQSIYCQLTLDSVFWSLIPGIISGNHVSMTAEGTVYLLHFERPYCGHMQHYLGFAYDLEQGLESHRQGIAGVTTRLAFNKGIGFTLARTWPGTPKLKRQIKDRGPVNYCPICPRRV